MLVVPILPHPPSATPAVLNILFEPSAALRSVVAAAAPPPEFATYAELVEWATARIADLPRDDPRLLDILSAHPRLGATAVDSAASRDEQASLRAGQADELRTLNELYERTFPGLRYVWVSVSHSTPARGAGGG